MILKKEDNYKASCVFCHYFSSFWNDDDDGVEEARDYGSCLNELNKDLDLITGEGIKCNFWEKIK